MRPKTRDARDIDTRRKEAGDKSSGRSTVRRRRRYGAAMSIKATIMDAATGAPIQTFLFGRRPYVGTDFTLESGERVTAQRVDIGKPAPGKFITPVDVWVTRKS